MRHGCGVPAFIRRGVVLPDGASLIFKGCRALPNLTANGGCGMVFSSTVVADEAPLEIRPCPRPAPPKASTPNTADEAPGDEAFWPGFPPPKAVFAFMPQ